MHNHTDPVCGKNEKPHPGYLLNDSRIAAVAEKIKSGLFPLHVTRAEIFLTCKCNMDCRYCKSKDYKMPEWDEKDLLWLIDTLAKRKTAHLQWTGGEVTTHPELVKFISRAKNLGMNNSISSNGTAGLSAYMELAEAGVRHFSFSLDHQNADVFDLITQTKGNLPRIAETVRNLCEKSAKTYAVVVNSVLTKGIAARFMKDDANQLRHFLKWCIGTLSDDFKFLPVSTERFENLFPDAETRKRFLDICRDTVPEKYTLFHYRLAMLEKGGHGLYSRGSHTCCHCLDDRSYDSMGAYPCIIHLREGGNRLYLHKDPIELKRKRLEDFFRSDRTKNRICRTFCFDIYRAFSDRVVAMLG